MCHVQQHCIYAKTLQLSFISSSAASASHRSPNETSITAEPFGTARILHEASSLGEFFDSLFAFGSNEFKYDPNSTSLTSIALWGRFLYVFLIVYTLFVPPARRWAPPPDPPLAPPPPTPDHEPPTRLPARREKRVLIFPGYEEI